MARDEDLDALAGALVDAAGHTVVLSGAGISVASDIPAFRGSGGLWARYDPMEYATLAAFVAEPAKVWRMLRELDAVLEAARPNPAHRALAALEDLGIVRCLITQNVDGLHQAAGSGRVVELHGSRHSLTCLECQATVPREEVEDAVEAERVPTCERCGGVLKPDVVFFGEDLPAGALALAEDEVRGCDLLLMVGTSAEVEPAASLPRLAVAGGATVWEVNPDPAGGSGVRPVARPAEEALPDVVDRVRSRVG